MSCHSGFYSWRPRRRSLIPYVMGWSFKYLKTLIFLKNSFYFELNTKEDELFKIPSRTEKRDLYGKLWIFYIVCFSFQTYKQFNMSLSKLSPLPRILAGLPSVRFKTFIMSLWSFLQTKNPQSLVWNNFETLPYLFALLGDPLLLLLIRFFIW